MARGREGAAHVHADHGVPVFLLHVDQRAVAQDACVVHQHVEAPKGVDGGVDAFGAVPVGHVVRIGDRLGAHGFDLGHDLQGRTAGGARAAIAATAEVVDHHLGALAGELQGVLASQASACTGDHDHAVLAKLIHRLFLFHFCEMSTCFDRAR